MKKRIWCAKHQRWHSQHAAYHCKQKKGCPPSEHEKQCTLHKEGR